jgi:hypothetical protein
MIKDIDDCVRVALDSLFEDSWSDLFAQLRMSAEILPIGPDECKKKPPEVRIQEMER